MAHDHGNNHPQRGSELSGRCEAVGTLGHVGGVDDHLVAVENAPKRHNIVVCTPCSCYPWKSSNFPRFGVSLRFIARVQSKTDWGVLTEFGVTLPIEIEIRLWDLTTETWFLVLPQRAGARRNSLITRGSMIGTGLPKNLSEVR